MNFFSKLVRSKILSLVFVLVVLPAAYLVSGNPQTVFYLIAALVLPLACIWFPDELGSVTGVTGGGLARPQVTEPTPGIMVAIGGWCLLIGITFSVFYFHLR